MANTDTFAIVPVPEDPGPLRTLITSNARMIGSKSAVMANIVDTRAQQDLHRLIRRADAARRVEDAIEAQKAEQREQALHSLCDGIARMRQRLDSLETRRELAAELNAQNQQIIDTYSIPADLPPADLPAPDADPTAATSPSQSDAVGGSPEPSQLCDLKGDYPAPNLQSDARANDADPEGKGWLPKPLEGNLTSSYSVVDPEELAHPDPAHGIY
jgi:hypothetical protein